MFDFIKRIIGIGQPANMEDGDMKPKKRPSRRPDVDISANLHKLPTRYGIILIGNNTLTVKFDPENPLRYQAIGTSEWREEPYILIRDIPMGQK